MCVCICMYVNIYTYTSSLFWNNKIGQNSTNRRRNNESTNQRNWYLTSGLHRWWHDVHFGWSTKSTRSIRSRWHSRHILRKMGQRDATVASGSTVATLLRTGRTQGQPSGTCVEGRVSAAGGQPSQKRPVIRRTAATRMITSTVAVGAGTRTARKTSILLITVTRRENRMTVTGLRARRTSRVTSAEASSIGTGAWTGTGRQATQNKTVVRAWDRTSGQSTWQPCVWWRGSCNNDDTQWILKYTNYILFIKVVELSS